MNAPSDQDFAFLLEKRHRARYHPSEWVRSGWTNAFDREQVNPGAAFEALSKTGHPTGDEGGRIFTREEFATSLRGNGETSPTPSEQVIMIYAWGGPRHGTQYAAPNAAKTTEKPRFTGGVARPFFEPATDARIFLLDPNQTFTAPRAPHSAGPYAAFDKLWNPNNRKHGVLHGMGTAYGTKVLYWAWRAHGQYKWNDHVPSPLPLVYDMHVFRAMNALGMRWSTGSEELEFPDPQHTVPYSSYDAYCTFAWLAADHLTQLASKRMKTAVEPFQPDDVEYWLFKLGSSAGEGYEKAGAESAPNVREMFTGTSGGPADEEKNEDCPDLPKDEAIDWDLLRETVQYLAGLFDRVVQVQRRDFPGGYFAANG